MNFGIRKFAENFYTTFLLAVTLGISARIIYLSLTDELSEEAGDKKRLAWRFPFM